MKNSLVLFFLVAILQLHAQSYSGPESVEWDAANNRWLISNTTSHAILARSQSGVLTTLVPTTTSGPHGLEILGNVVYACCGSSIKGYDLTTGTQVFSLNLGASFLNGLTTDGDSVLYATDFSNRDIFRINPSTSDFYVMSTNSGTQSPNGIIYDGPNNRCIFVNWGANAPIKAIGLNPPYTITTITTTTLGSCDGITRDQLGYYYVTSWGNQRLNRFTSTFTGGHTVMNGWTLNSPADIDCKFGTIDTVGVPNSGNNTCTFIPLAPPTPSYTMNDSTICVGDQITFTNTSLNAVSFSWIFDGGNPGAGSTSPANVDFDTAGTYSVVLTTTNIYGTTSVTHQVIVAPAPTPVIVAVVNDLSTSTTFTTYQWYHDGVLIVGATSQNYTVISGGDYYCIVTDANGCAGTSNVINSTLAIEDNFEVNTKVFPNPAAEMLTVEMMLPEAQSINYSIIDMQGRVLRSSTEVFEYQGLNYIIIDLDGITNGTYVLKLNAENIVLNRSFVVSK